MEVLLASQQNALTGSPSVDWTRKKADARERGNEKFVASRHLQSVNDVKRALRAKYERAGPIDRGPAFRRTRASCGGQLNLPGFRHFLDLSGIYVSNPPGRDIIRELWESKRNAASRVIEFPEFAELCFGNQPIISDMGAPHQNEQSQMARARSRTQFQDAQADAAYRAGKPDHFAILRDKLQRRGKRSFSEKFAMLQLLASYKDRNLREDGMALALKKIGMKLTDAEFQEFFAACDLNRDGEIDFSEFAAVIMGAPGYLAPADSSGKRERRPLQIIGDKSPRLKARQFADAAQAAAERGYHRLKSVPALREKLVESFNKLNSGASAAQSFRRLKTAAGAAIDAIQFKGLMRYIHLNKIPADADLARQLFSKMLRNTRPRGTSKKTAFSFDDFKIEFFEQQPTSAFQEEDSLLAAQMSRIRAREQAQERAREEMAARMGIYLDPNAPVVGGNKPHPSAAVSEADAFAAEHAAVVAGAVRRSQRDPAKSPMRGAAREMLRSSSGGGGGGGGDPPPLPAPAAAATSPSKPRARFAKTGVAQPRSFRALPNPHVRSSHLTKAVDIFAPPSVVNSSRQHQHQHQNQHHRGAGNPRERRKVEIPRNGSKHTRADPRISLQVMLRKKGVANASRRDIEQLLNSGGGD